MNIEEQYDRLYRYCYFHTGDPVLAEDLTQEAFLRYFSRKPAVGTGRPMAYLYTIARNLCIDHYRKRKTEEFRKEELVFLPMEQVEEKMDLAAALGTLDKQHREILLLRYVNELGVGETAKVLGISRFCVYRREREAMEKLRNYMKGEKSL